MAIKEVREKERKRERKERERGKKERERGKRKKERGKSEKEESKEREKERTSSWSDFDTACMTSSEFGKCFNETCISYSDPIKRRSLYI